MHGKVIVITGASGALGNVVADAAIACGAKVAGIDRAVVEQQCYRRSDRIRRRRSDRPRTSPAGRRCGGCAFRPARRSGQYRWRVRIRDDSRRGLQNMAAPLRDQRDDRAERLAGRDPASGCIRRRTYRQHRRDRSITGRRWHGRLCCVESGRASADRSACLRVERQGDRQCRPALDDRHASQSQGHAQSGFRDVGDGPRTNECHSVSGQRCGKRSHRGVATRAWTRLKRDLLLL